MHVMAAHRWKVWTGAARMASAAVAADIASKGGELKPVQLVS
jgi:hypothetical protein